MVGVHATDVCTELYLPELGIFVNNGISFSSNINVVPYDALNDPGRYSVDASWDYSWTTFLGRRVYTRAEFEGVFTLISVHLKTWYLEKQALPFENQLYNALHTDNGYEGFEETISRGKVVRRKPAEATVKPK